ncbi:DUF1868 domain-containing protein [Granulicella sp. WH15]|uniref:DUF1868 domain-containing protein n=1 Tax=Granulicella sp. WH15 TaxID=2602070 RepID=UPI0013679356|nr:DUF1868 domain-containing protein [Granulicella sp. WH15]QHN03671.1 DUF1868 domain-containing protein [Granulicella sp. WH15]
MLSFSQSIRTRRQFLLRTSALSLSAFIPPQLSAQVIRSANTPEDDLQLATIPKDTLLKFNPDGSPRPFAGNTVICHLPQQTRFHDAVVAFGHALRSSSFGAKIAGLPDDSYHATILGGPNDQDRDRYGWPSDIPITTPMAECNRVIGERFARFRMHTELPLRFRLDTEKTLAPQRPSGLQLVPADADEKLKIRALRDRLSDEVFRYRTPDHDTFGFHISMAYQVVALTSMERREYQSILTGHLRTLVEASPVIELGVPEFCTFGDMYRFEIRTLLRT